MTDERTDGELTPAERRARHRRLAEVFGEALPEQTDDDADDPRETGLPEEWLKQQVPPHHVFPSRHG